MKGEENIDLLMIPVLKSIKRHVTSRDAITDIYNRAYEAVMISLDVKNEQRRKEFCPNCEADVPCTHEAELFVCDICGEDFAKYIMSRKADVSDYSVTQDVLTDIKTPRSIENKLTDTEACNARLVEKVEELREQLRWRLVKEEEPPIDELIIVRGERHMIWSGMQLGHGVIKTQLGEYALWMRIPNVEQE